MIDLSDPISRQQTITALRALSDEDGYINVPHEVVTDVVRGLPPVQAKHEQITHSEQPKKDKLGVKAGETYKDTISRQALCEYALNQKDKSVTPNDIMRFPSAQPEQRWIPCSERLPEAEVEVFVYLFDRPLPHIAWMSKDGKWHTEDFTLEVDENPAAWMPMPKPYKEEQDEID